jgi:sigma-B regulation protein RsbU (phosphoserine phosphatase)
MQALIVEDDRVMAHLLAEVLTAARFAEPVVVESAEEAFRLLTLDDAGAPAGLPQIIFMDIQLGGVDGIEACARIKADARYADVPVIMVTASSDIDALQMAFVAGASDYITKPINPAELLARARSAIRLKYEIERLQAQEEAAERMRARILELEESLGAQAAVDPVTRLPLRGILRKVASYHFDGVPTLARHAIAVVVLDAFDNYLMFHQEGPTDAVLAKVANALVNVGARAGDLLVRSDRGSFALLMPDVAEDAGRQTADRLRLAVFELGIPHEYSSVDAVVTASVGVAESSAQGAGHHATVLAAAEHAAARAIDAGGNHTQEAVVQS